MGTLTTGLDPYDFTIKQGSTFRLPFVLLIGGIPVDVTYYQARMQIRRRIEDEETILSVDETDGITVGTEDGSFVIEISDEETALLDVRDFPAYYDVEVESAGGDVYTLLEGRVGLKREVTRAGVS